MALISDRPRRRDTRRIVFSPKRTHAHAEAGCFWLAVDRSLPLLGGDVCCLAVDPSPVGPIPGPAGLSTGAKPSYVASVSKREDPHHRSEVRLQEHSFGALVSVLCVMNVYETEGGSDDIQICPPVSPHSWNISCRRQPARPT